MSAPAVSLPAEIRELMWLTSVEWEAASGRDVYNDESYAAPVTVECWIEPMGLSGGIEAFRASISGTTDLTTDEPTLELYFDGSDANVQTFTMSDRFTPGEFPQLGIRLQPRRISVLHGPNFDNAEPWIVIVGL